MPGVVRKEGAGRGTEEGPQRQLPPKPNPQPRPRGRWLALAWPHGGRSHSPHHPSGHHRRTPGSLRPDKRKSGRARLRSAWPPTRAPPPFASAGVGSVGGAVRCGWEGGTDWQLLLLRQAAAAPLARPRGPGPWCGGGAWPRPPNERANAMGGGGGGAHDGHVPLLSGRAAANGDPSKFLRRVPIHLQLRLGICVHHQESPPLVMLLQASAGVRSLIYHPSA